MGLKSILGLFFANYVSWKNSSWKKNPIAAQEKVFSSLIFSAKNTVFGKKHGFSKITSHKDFVKAVPITDYEGLRVFIDQAVGGKKDVLWPGKPAYFATTSGTTSGAKYIPISKDSMPYHIICARDAILAYIKERANTSIINGKMIFLQGSPELKKVGDIPLGRLSGIVAHHIPGYLKKNQLPSFSTNCLEDWEVKINKIVEETLVEKMTLISGIPPWVQMYFEKIHEKTGRLIKDVFPDFNLFIYGGVNYDPYRKAIGSLIGKKIDSIELYPASEGFIAYQDSQKKQGMLLCVNHGIFYEFIPVDSFFEETPSRLLLADVCLGVNYVIVLSTNAGLWGYNLGDTIKFVSLSPYRIIVTGRIKHFTSAFGEHVIGEEVEKSLQLSIAKFSGSIVEFHVAPQVSPKNGLPYHEWFVEFGEKPKNLTLFAEDINVNLCGINSYYNDLIVGRVLQPLVLREVPKNGFRKYMASIGKLGGQNKVPRLANDRKIAEKLKKIN